MSKSTLSAIKLPSVLGLVSAPALGTLPSAPLEWQPPPPMPRAKGSRAQRRALASQKGAVVAAAQEVAGSSTFAKTFGAGAPSVGGFASILALAGLWSTDIIQVIRWMAWARQNEAAAWSRAFAMLDAFQPVFEAAVARDATVAETYPSLAQYYGAGHQKGQKSASGRKAAKAGAAAAAPAAPTVAPVPVVSNAGGVTPSK